MVISGSSARKRRTSSSVSEDLPAPPVPVAPRTGAGFEGGQGAEVEAVLGAGDGAGDGEPAVGGGADGAGEVDLAGVEVGGLDHRGDHPVETHGAAVLGGEDLGHAVGLELGDLARDDDAAAAAEDLDVRGAALLEEIDHVLEELDVAALVGRDRDGLGVLLDGGVDDFLDRTVVAEVDDLGALRLEDPAHDVDRRVVAVEERGGGDEADLVGGLVAIGGCHGPSRRVERVRF